MSCSGMKKKTKNVIIMIDNRNKERRKNEKIKKYNDISNYAVNSYGKYLLYYVD